MKEETINKLTEKALEYLNSAEAFASEQIPAYIEELLSFKVFEHLVNSADFLLILPFFIISLTVVYLAVRADSGGSKARNNNRIISAIYGKDLEGPLIVIGSFASVITGIAFFVAVAGAKHDMLNAYKAHKAPRVYLVEYFKGQVE